MNNGNFFLNTKYENINEKILPYINWSNSIAIVNSIAKKINAYKSNDNIGMYELYYELNQSLAENNISTETPYGVRLFLRNYKGNENKYVESFSDEFSKGIVDKILKMEFREFIFNVSEDKRTINLYKNYSIFTNEEIILKLIIPIDKLIPNSDSTDNFFYKIIVENKVISDSNIERLSSSKLLTKTLPSGLGKIEIYVQNSIITIKIATILIILIVVSTLAFLFMIFGYKKAINYLTNDLYSFIDHLKDENYKMNGDEVNSDIAMMKNKFVDMINVKNQYYEDLLGIQNENSILQLDLLEARFNPHLLYNSLSILRWRLLDNNEHKSILIVDSLVNYYRLALSGGDTIVSLETELAFAKKYVEVMSHIKNVQYDCKFDVDKLVYKMRIPKHVLQPFIENSILHGLNNLVKEPIITIIGKIVNEKIVITINDNGIGIEKENLEKIVTGKMEEEKKSFGIKSALTKLKWFYGEGFGFSIESLKNEGTTVTIVIPQEPMDLLVDKEQDE